MKILAVIPARGGSKGIPNKNLVLLNDRPLISYSISAAMASPSLSDLVVSTDSDAIRSTAEHLGATVIMRPPDLATDTAPTAPVVSHALDHMEAQHGPYDAVMVLQPTSPLRSSHDIEAAAEAFRSHPDADSLISCYDGASTHPRIMYLLSDGRLTPLTQGLQVQRRQTFEPVYVRNGAIYLVRRPLIADKGKLIGDLPLALLMPKERSINIDEPLDLELAEFWLKRTQNR